MPIDLRQLKYFESVARFGSITRAALELHIVQPALSRQISMIEEELGQRLFNRLPRGVVLTRAGEELLDYANQMLKMAASLPDRIGGAANGLTGKLRVGVMPGYSWLPSLSASIRSMWEASPNVKTELIRLLSGRQIEMLKRREIDVGVMAWRSAFDPALTGMSVYKDRMVVAIPRDRPVARKRLLRLQDLSEETFLLFPRERAPYQYDRLMTSFSAAGFQPRQGNVIISDIPTSIDLVDAGLGCGIAPVSSARRKLPGVVLREAIGLDFSYDLELVWRSDEEDPLVKAFVRRWQLAMPLTQHARG
ncbi:MULTISPECIES: LysR family transcriptional regulator [unclassified Variovorax]|uniref:LysR family transcriptional regulator n=1 Tax=unclassified Variovorax TaxID=663243 RepID=UPI003F47E786